MKIKRFIYTLFTLFSSIFVIDNYCQYGEENNYKNEPGMMVDHLTSIVGKEGFASFSGDLNFSQKLLTVPGRNGLDYEIRLNYNNAIRSKQEATWVGLGFSLQIGSVTRKVVYRVDEQKEDFFTSPSYNFNLDEYELLVDSDDEKDGQLVGSVDRYEEWDQYTLNMPNGSFEMVPLFDDQGYPYFKTKDLQPWKIDYNLKNVVDFIQNFRVIKENGVSYFFGHRSDLKINEETSGLCKIRMKYPVSWELTEVHSSDYIDVGNDGVDDNDKGSWIKIEYNDYAVGDSARDFIHKHGVKLGYGKVYGQEGSSYDCEANDRQAHLLYDYSHVSKIITPTHTAEFITLDRDDLRDSYLNPIKKLERIILKDKEENIIKTIEFIYATINNNQTDPNWEVNEKLMGNSLTLVGLKETGENNQELPNYKFEYWGLNPSYLGASNLVMYPHYPGNPAPWSLSKIITPSGGSVEFDFQHDKYNWFLNFFDADLENFKVYYNDSQIELGGSRLSQITYDDKIHSPFIYSLEYGEGMLHNPDMTSDHDWNFSSQYNPPSQQSGIVGYRSTKVNFPNQGGSVVNYFTSGVTTNYLHVSGSSNPPSPAVNDSKESFPDEELNSGTWFWLNKSALRGRIWKREIYADGSTNPIAKDLKNYDVDSFWGADAYAYKNKFGYPANVFWVKLESENNTLDNVSAEVEYTFDPIIYDYELPQNLLPRTISSINSEGSKRIVDKKYAFEKYSNMYKGNIVSQEYTSTTYLGSISNTNAYSSSKIEWTDLNGGANYQYRFVPTSTYKWKEDIVTKNYEGEDDSEYKLISQRDFNDYGNLISEEDGEGMVTKYLFSHNHSKVIGKVTNSGDEDILFDNFNDNDLTADPFFWTTSSGWTTTDGKLLSPYSSPYTFARIQNEQYQSFNVDVQLKIIYTTASTYWAGIHFGTTSTDYRDGYLVFYRQNGQVVLYKGGSYLEYANIGIIPDKLRRLSVSVDGANISVLLDGQEVINYTESSSISSGYVSLYSYKASTEFDNFRVYPIDALAEGYAYDPITLMLNENTDANNFSKYKEYDKLGRLSTVHTLEDGEKTIVEEYEYYLSRDHNGDTFDEDDPNYTEITLHSDQLNTSKIAFYTDGFNKTIQEQSLLGNSIIVNKSLEYNSQSQIYKSYKPYIISGSTPSYDSDASTHSDNYYNNQLGDYGDYTATNGRPFYGTGYRDDPLQRKEYEAPEGTAWWNSGKLKYFGNSGNDADVIPLVTGFPTPYYSENTLYKSGYTDEQGLTVLSYSDKFGNLIAKREDPSFLDLMTLFSYDILGNLIKTTDPNGLVSTYSYNTINKLTEKTTPDAGSSKFLYDQNNNLRFNRNAEHNNTATHNYYYSNYLYGSTTQTGSFSTVKPAVVNIYVKTYNLVAGLNEIITLKLKNTSTSQVTLFEITAEDNGNSYIFKKIRLPKGSFNWEVITSGQSGSKFYFYVNSRYNIQFEYNKYDKFNRVTENGENYYYYSYSDKFTQSNVNNYTFPSTGLLLNSKFNYDFASDDAILVEQQRNLRGKVSSALSYDMNDLAFSSFYSYNDQGNVEWVVNKWVSGKNNKVKYKYDLQGKITQIDFLGDHSSYNYYKFFEYDDIGRLANVYTADNASGTNKTKEAEYEYYADGSVKRMELGADGNKAQGVDYLYNTRGWLSQINHQNLTSNDDPGGDGANGIPLDKFGMVIGYNSIAHIGSSQNAVAQWSGNISWLMYKIYGVTSGGSLVGNTYTYDNVNRLKLSDYGYYSGSWLTTNNYDVRNINYDYNGNITGIQRYWNNGLLFDNQTFVFNTGTNGLNRISDYASSSISTTDIDNQNTNNYLYDENGNVIQDEQQGIGFILYDVHNMPTKIYYTNGDVVEYIYDVNGNRVTKKVEDDNILWNYAYGANGNVEARIKENSYPPTHVKHNLWGNDLVGIREYISYYTTTDEKYYYLKDHLGSIKVRVDENGDVVGYDDYYPFGMVMNGRSGSTGTEEGYKYTGKERDIETGLDYFGARYYDSKIGRWLSVDPLADKYPGWSPYNYVLNNPLNSIDPNGDSVWVNYNDANGNAQSLLYTQGMSYKGGIKQVAQIINTLNTIGSVESGNAVLGSLISSSGNYAFSFNSLKANTGAFRANKGGLGGTFYIGAYGGNIETVAHEAFHAFQHDNRMGGASIANEVDAYLYGQAIALNTGNVTSSVQNNTLNGQIYNRNMSSLLYGNQFSLPHQSMAIKYFKTGSSSNATGLYNKFPLKRPGQFSLLNQFYPLIK